MAINTTFTSGAILTASQMNALPFGVVKAVKGTAGNQSLTGTTTDITGMTSTFTAISGRLYKVTFSGLFVKSSAAGDIDIFITDGSNNIIYDFFQTQPLSSYTVISFTGVLSGLSGSTTIKARVSVSAGAGTLFMTSSNPSTFIIEDIGQA